jgi:HEAT repeat protein
MKALSWLVGLLLLCLGIYLQIQLKMSPSEDARVSPEESATAVALRAAIGEGETDRWLELIEALAVEKLAEASVLEDLLLRTTDRDVLKQILQVLETTGEAEGVHLLYRIGKRDSDLAELAAVRLSRVHTRAAVPALVEVLDLEGRGGLFAAAATRALGQTRLRHHVPRLIELAREGDLDVQLAALDGLGTIADLEALPVLIHLLKDPGARVRRHTIRALSRIRSPRAVVALEEFLRGKPSPPPFEVSLVEDSLARQRGENPGPWSSRGRR